MILNQKNSDIESSLNKLKEYFKDEINSKRKLERISDVEELFETLRDRDILADKKVTDLGLNFQNFVNFQIKNSNQCTKPVLPSNVVNLLSENFKEDWRELGISMSISDIDLNKSCTVENVLKCFQDSCKGVSQEEIIFRLLQAIEKCGRENLKLKINKLVN